MSTPHVAVPLAVAAAFTALAMFAPLSHADGPFGDTALTPIERLGKALFEDASLSEPAGQSCASCHDPALAFTGNAGSSIPAISRGAASGAAGTRNTPTIMYTAFSPLFSFVTETGENGQTEHIPTGGLFHDGRAKSLADQVHTPLLNPAEMNNASADTIAAKLRATYAPDFIAVFGPGALQTGDRAMDSLAAAIAAYESSARFMPFQSKFDRHLRGEADLSRSEMRGFALFKDPDKGNCIACHAGNVHSRDPRDWLFTDFTYDNLGVPRNAAIPANADMEVFDLGLCKQEGIEGIAPDGFDIGSLCGAFKVPTLRNVAVTAPYFHNGVFTSLRDVVAFYATRDTDPGRWYGNENARFDDLPRAFTENVNTGEPPYDRKPGETPRLNDAEIDDLVAFLRTLTDDTVMAAQAAGSDQVGQ